ncbi:MAG: four helix bundle protein [Candidatus Symbiothrix sp.]|jgi:four helix bundle protein|nr:four helix bundle protein [Candidatus Symbiothrix sp.]
MARTHKNLIVWQKGLLLVKLLYQYTQLFPKEELFGLTSQMRRCAVSIPSNIAEGFGRHSGKELLQFLNIALGSASELETQLIISNELAFLPEKEFDDLSNLNNEIIKMLISLANTIRSRPS